jgi:predicted dehydrogenase
LEAVKAAVAETGRIFSICFSERHCVRSAVKAGKLVKAGAIGTVIQTLGMGPHRLQLPTRPDWFFDPKKFGGIIVDIASHQVDQFLFYTGSTSRRRSLASSIGNFGMPEKPAFQDFGEVLLRSDKGSGYIRVDWFTPGGAADLGRWPPDHPRHRRLYRACANISTSKAGPARITCSSSTARR